MIRKTSFTKPFHTAKFLKFFFLLFSALNFPVSVTRAQTELVINATGYGFDKSASNGINAGQWEYINKFVNISHNGRDASATAVRLHVEWHQYEPKINDYQRQKIVEAVKAIIAL